MHLTWKRRIGIGGTVLTLGALGGVTLHQQQAWLLQEATRLTSTLASETLGVPLEIARLEGLTWHGVVLRDVRLRGSDAPGSPVVARIPELQVTIDPLDWLRLGPRAVHLTAVRPEVRLERDAAGRLNLTPSRSGKGSSGIAAPPLRLTLRDGKFHWSDPHLKATLTRIAGDLTLCDGVATLTATGWEAQSRIRIEGRHRLAASQGSGSVELANLDLPRWSRALSPQASWKVLEGTGNARLQAQWGETSRVSGTFQARGAATLPGLSQPLRGITLSGSLADRTLTLSELRGTVAGIPLQAHGTLSGLAMSRPMLAMTLEAPRIDLARLGTLLPELAAQSPSGSGEVHATLSGPLGTPTLTGTFRIPSGSVAHRSFRDAAGTMRFARGVLTVPQWSVSVGGGTVRGESRLPLAPRGALETTATWNDIRLAEVWKADSAMPVKGTSSGRVALRGMGGDRIAASGQVSLTDGGYGPHTVQAASAQFRWAPSGWTVTSAQARLVQTELRGSVSGDPAGNLRGRFEVPQLAPERLTALGHDLPVKGDVKVAGTFDGHVQRGLRFAGTASGDRVVLSGQPVEAAAVTWTFAQGKLALPAMSGRIGGETVTGRGWLALGGEAPTANLTVRIPDGDLRRILGGITWPPGVKNAHWGQLARVGGSTVGPLGAPLLGTLTLLDRWQVTGPADWQRRTQEANRPWWQALDGRLRLDYQLTGRLDRPMMRVHAEIANAKAYGLALNQAEIDASYHGERLTVHRLDVRHDTGEIRVTRPTEVLAEVRRTVAEHAEDALDQALRTVGASATAAR